MTLHSVPAFKRYVTSLPATEIVQQWGGFVGKVGGKVFTLIGEAGEPIVFKVTEESFEILTAIDGVAQAPYFAKRQWVSVSEKAELPEEHLRTYLERSHRLIAKGLTKKLRTELGIAIG